MTDKLTPADIRAIIIGALLALFLSALDQTIVATALPPIARDLGNFELISWVVTAYLVTSTCVTPIVGKLSDLYGRRPVLRVCLVVFILGSGLCALAPGMVPLILARALQGVGGGGLITLAQTIIGDVVTPRERGRYSAYFSVVWASSSLLGPTLGGVLTEELGWPWIFWINLPLGAVALLIADRALRKLPTEHHRSPIDYAGIGLLSGSTVALLMVLSLGGKRLPWTAAETLTLGAAVLVLGGLFVRQQLRAAEPILPPRFVEDGVIRPVLCSIFIIFGSYLAIAVLTPIYFQVALGAPVSKAGLLMIPLTLSSVITANMAGRYSQRSGRYKRPPLLGLPVAIVTLAIVALFANSLSPLGASLILDDNRLRARPDLPVLDRGGAKRRRAPRSRCGERRRRLFAGARRRHRDCRGIGAGPRPLRQCLAGSRARGKPRGSRSLRAAAGGPRDRGACFRHHVRRRRRRSGYWVGDFCPS